MADLPFLQKGTEGTQIQEPRLAEDHNGVLVSALPHPPEHDRHL